MIGFNQRLGAVEDSVGAKNDSDVVTRGVLDWASADVDEMDIPRSKAFGSRMPPTGAVKPASIVQTLQSIG
jgi:hypothetical protein